MTAKRFLSNALLALILATSQPAQAGAAADSVAIADSASQMPDARLSAHTDTMAPTRQYINHITKRINFWNSLIPNLSHLQYAGDIGMISMGMGWDYGKHNQWETFLIFGITPRNHTPRTYVTMAVKEMFTPWDVKVWRHVEISPLFASFTISTLLDGEFWVKNPERYPSGYYSFSTKTRLHLGIGQKIKLKNIQHKSHFLKHLALFYEVSTCDLYLINKIRNRSIPTKDIICLAIGIQATFF